MVLVKQNWKYAHEIGKMEKYDVAGVLRTQKVENRAIHWGNMEKTEISR